MNISEHFSQFELQCHCGCGRNEMHDGFLVKLEMIRAVVGPMIITSAYRCPKHNQNVSSTGSKGPHTTGRAVDVRCAGSMALRLIEEGLRVGMTGIGVKQHGNYSSRFIHLDDLAGEDYPRPTIWTY